MKSILNIFCLACVLGLIGCSSQDLTQTVDKERGRDLTSSTIKLDTTYLNFNIGEVELNNEDTKTAIAELLQTNAPRTRAITLDGKGKMQAEQTFTAICYLLNTKTNQLGRFELDWIIKKNGTKITLAGEQIRKNIPIVWKHGTTPTTISGNDWQVCGIAGGGKELLKENCESVSFEPLLINVTGEGQVAIPFLSNYRPVKFTDKNIAHLNFGFNFVGTLLKLKVKRDNSVTDDQDFFFNTTGLNPIGVFLMQDLTTHAPLNKPLKELWTSTIPLLVDDSKDSEKYHLTLKGSDALKVTENKTDYFIWYVWGMPNTERSTVETTMGSLTGGYIVKLNNKQGPLWSKHNFSNDEGKVKTFNLSIHNPEPFPSFFFLNILERAAEHNLEAAKTWWESDKVKVGWSNRHMPVKKPDESVFFSYDQAVNPDFMPAGYHLPSLDEMTILFPYAATVHDGEDDLYWKKDFTNKTSPWTEWVTLYAYQDTYITSDNRKMWVVCDNATDKDHIASDNAKQQELLQRYYDRNIKGFYSYIYNPNGGNVIYSIRFAENSVYSNKIRCAYKWDFRHIGLRNYSDGYVEITSRWIGDAPVTIDDIIKDEWWQHNGKHNVVRRLPAQGETSGKGVGNFPYAGTYLCSGKYDFGTFSNGNFARVFNTDWYGGTFQRKSHAVDKGLIHPFKNTMMCNERSAKGGDEFFEENTGNGGGQTFPLP